MMISRRAPAARREIVRLDELVPSGRRNNRRGQRVFGDAVKGAEAVSHKPPAKGRPRKRAND
jgi:hypothetical protein